MAAREPFQLNARRRKRRVNSQGDLDAATGLLVVEEVEDFRVVVIVVR